LTVLFGSTGAEVLDFKGSTTAGVFESSTVGVFTLTVGVFTFFCVAALGL
jgi:hypothetical protein